MDEEKFFVDLKEALFQYFGHPATPDNLTKSFGSATIKQAKKVGIFVARKAGLPNSKIAQELGFSNAHAVSRVFNKAVEEFYEDHHDFSPHVRHIASELSVKLEND